MVSDGRNLTSGTREQSDFLTPVLTGPDQTAVTDEPTIRKIAALIAAQKHRVLLVRPDAPDANLNASKKPFSAPGTYVIYNASSQLTADVVVQCSGQEQTWTFLAEADPSVGQVNCTVEPRQEQRARPAGLPEQLLTSDRRAAGVQAVDRPQFSSPLDMFSQASLHSGQTGKRSGSRLGTQTLPHRATTGVPITMASVSLSFGT